MWLGIQSNTIEGNITFTGSITAGASESGQDVIFYGDTSGKKMTWDASADMLDIDGVVKIHNRPVSTDIYALEVKGDFDAASGTYQGAFQCSARAYPSGDTTTAGVRGGYFQSQLHSGDTMTGSASLIGLHCQAHNNGTLNGSGIVIAPLHTYIEDGGTWTAVSHACSIWVDNHLTKTITAGSFDMVYITNNAATVADDVFYIYGGDKISYFAKFDTVSGMASETNGSVLADISGTTNAGYIKVAVDGTDKYLALYDIKTS